MKSLQSKYSSSDDEIELSVEEEDLGPVLPKSDVNPQCIMKRYQKWLDGDEALREIFHMCQSKPAKSGWKMDNLIKEVSICNWSFAEYDLTCDEQTVNDAFDKMVKSLEDFEGLSFPEALSNNCSTSDYPFKITAVLACSSDWKYPHSVFFVISENNGSMTKVCSGQGLISWEYFRSLLRYSSSSRLASKSS
jgi:hypothetical protein